MSSSLSDFLKDLDSLLKDATKAFSKVDALDDLEESRVSFLGAKNGRLKSIQKGMGKVAKQFKPEAGKKLNEVKKAVETAFRRSKEMLESSSGSTETTPCFDATLPGEVRRIGTLHPITQTIEDIKDIMGRLGFSVVEGPEVEDEWHNFGALNIALSHPARDPLDNFYLATAEKVQKTSNLQLMRSQTSTVQIRVMEKQKPPIRIISLGRVYRPDPPDRTHYPMFHQIEGLLVDKHVTMAQLKTTLRLFATSFFGDDVVIRFRPSFFPFTEPSVEVDMLWGDRWVEIGGAGMVDPNVLNSVGYDPHEVSGFAFGLGVERVCMGRHKIADIRDLFKNDIRFLHQFS